MLVPVHAVSQVLCPPPCSYTGTQCPYMSIPEFGGWRWVTAQVAGHCQDSGTPSSELLCKTVLCSSAPGSPPAAQAAVGTSTPASSPMVPGQHTWDCSMHPASSPHK